MNCGKFDSVDLIDGGIYLQANKTICEMTPCYRGIMYIVECLGESWVVTRNGVIVYSHWNIEEVQKWLDIQENRLDTVPQYGTAW